LTKVVFTVSNDVFTDQRVNKMAQTLYQMGFVPLIAGIKGPSSLPFSPGYTRVIRLPLWFQKGFLFYAELNIRLFFFLLRVKTDLIVANDLDTLLPAWLVARIRRKSLIYDTHEYFTGTPDVAFRPFRRWFWGGLENWLFPKQQTIITVNQSIAELYSQKYRKTLHVVRNLPRYQKIPDTTGLQIQGVGADENIVVVQGSGLNTGRGIEELILAMEPQHGITNTKLLVIGDGNARQLLEELVRSKGLHGRVLFLPRMPYDLLMKHTARATIGATLDKPFCLNYFYSLPNKLFDYIMADTPVLASNLPEVRNIVATYKVGMIAENHEPAHLASCIKEMLSDGERLAFWKENCKNAARMLNWEKEEPIIRAIYARFLKQS